MTIIFFCNLYALIEIVSGIRQMRNLAHIEPQNEIFQPLVSIIVPACNEQDTIQPALHSLLTLEYANTEIIVINDRSTDNTATVLEDIENAYSHMHVHKIERLPEGWLGKNHALHRGALFARGEYLLFTDADILFQKTTLSRAISLMIGEKLDHLSLIFKNIARGGVLNAMVVDAGGGLFFLFKPWKVSNRKSKYFMGVGAFNLIKKSVYMELGGHQSISMHPIDDIMLGKIVKQAGYKQECLTAYNFLKVHWYASPRKMIDGLMKNIFALYNFRITSVMLAVVMVFLLTILPLWGLFFASGGIRLACLLSVCVRLLSTAYGAKFSGTTYKAVPCSLLSPYLSIYIMLTGMIGTFVNKGIYWRGTHYPLDQLKRNKPIL